MTDSRAQALATTLAQHLSAPPRSGQQRVSIDETHRVALVHPEYDGFITMELQAQCDLADVRVVVGPELDAVLTAHHKTGPLMMGQARPVDLELHPGSIEAPATSGLVRIVDELGVDAAPALRVTLATDRSLECQLAGAIDGPWEDPAEFERAAADLCAGHGGARALARRITLVANGQPDPGWSRLPWRRR